MLTKNAKAIPGLVLLSLLSAPRALADGWQLPDVGGLNLPDADFNDLIMQVVDWLLGFIVIMAVIVLIWGGLVYIGSAGDQDRVMNAKRTVKYALMGLILAGIAFAAVNAIVNTLQ